MDGKQSLKLKFAPCDKINADFAMSQRKVLMASTFTWLIGDITTSLKFLNTPKSIRKLITDSLTKVQ